MTGWFEASFFDNTVGDYLWAAFRLVLIVIVLVLAKRLAVIHFGRMAKATANDLDDFLVALLSQIGAPVFIAAALFIVTQPLQLADPLRTAIRYVFVLVLTVRVVRMIQQTVRYSIGKSYRRARPDDASAETVVRNLTNMAGWAIWALGAVFILDNLGVDISALVAGLGIGGIAVAMASQAILGDLFSALSIFVDKPFEVGDFIIVDGLMGTVEYVGLKTTRIRSLSGEQLILSNSDLTKSRIKNYKRMEVRRIVFKVGVVYQTSVEKARKVPGLITKIFEGMKGVRLDRVHLESLGDFSMNYEIVYYVLSADYNVYMDKQQEINLSIKEAFEREKIDFAYPTQTLYVPSVQGLSAQ